jgi:hypothetical protein
VPTLPNPDRLADRLDLMRRRQAVEAKAAFVVTILGDVAEAKPALDVSPAPR